MDQWRYWIVDGMFDLGLVFDNGWHSNFVVLVKYKHDVVMDVNNGD